MIYRAPTESDYPGMQALDLELARLEQLNFDALSQKDRAAALRSSLPALKFYARSEHSFVAVDASSLTDQQPSSVYGFILAQSVWMGDKAIVWVSSIRVHPDAPPGCLPGLLHCVTKSAYDGAVYELHLAADGYLEAIALREGYKDVRTRHLIRVLGSRGEL